MQNQLLLASIEKIINEAKGKLHKQQQCSNQPNYTREMQDWLKFLHEKRKQILTANQKSEK